MKNKKKYKTANNFLHKVIVLLGILFVLVACKTRQTMTSATGTDHVPSPQWQTEPMAEELGEMNHKQLDYNWITYRASASISNVDLKNLNVFVVNRKDSIIYVTISKLGMEGGRLVLTPDTVKYINHIQSNYYAGDYSIVERLFGFKIDFYMVQSLLTGEDFPHFESHCEQTKINENRCYRFDRRKNNRLGLCISQNIVVNQQDKIIENTLVEQNTQTSVQAKYGNFTAIDAQWFFQQADFVVSKADLQINVGVKSIKLNEAGPTSIRIPEKYTPINY